jgi:hypothetical protein
MHDGLTSLVKKVCGLDPFSGPPARVPGQTSRPVQDRVLRSSGFVLYYKRPEKGRFVLPRLIDRRAHGDEYATDFTMLLDGIDLSRVGKRVLWEPRASSLAQKLDRRAAL